MLIYENMNNIYLCKLHVCKRIVVFYMACGGVNYVYFLGFKLNCFIPPQIFRVTFCAWKFQFEQMVFLIFIATLCMWANFN